MRLFRRSQVKPRPSSAAAAGSAPAVAEALLLAGASVMLIDRDPKSTAETVQSLSDLGRASSTIGDVSDRAAAEDAVSTAIDRLSAVDILVNHAQALRPGVPLIATTEADFRLALDSGLWGTFNVMQLCYPHLANGGGAVINFASSAGIMGQAGMAAYAATKEAIRGMSLGRSEGAKPGRHHGELRVPGNARPGRKAWADQHPDLHQEIVRQRPIPRDGDAITEIGAAVVFLAGPGARFITGES